MTRPFLHPITTLWRSSCQFAASLFPHYCLLCEQPLEADLDLCPFCRDSLPWNLAACERCGMPRPDPGSPACNHCARHPPPCGRTLAPLLYQAAISRWVRQFKFSQGWRAGHVLGELVAEYIAQQVEPASRPDVLVPIPLSRWRLLVRGHDQALALARAIGRRTGCPVEPALLRRQRHTRKQADLPRSQRAANVARAFVATSGVAGRHVALVDDVLTTGSTLTAATRELLARGATKVDWWVAARTR